MTTPAWGVHLLSGVNTPFSNAATGASSAGNVYVSASHVMFLPPVILAFLHGYFGIGYVILIETFVSLCYHLLQTDVFTTILGRPLDDWARLDLLFALLALVMVMLYLIMFKNYVLSVQFYVIIWATVTLVWALVGNDIIEYVQASLASMIAIIYLALVYYQHMPVTVSWKFRFPAYVVVMIGIGAQIAATFIDNSEYYVWLHGTWHVALGTGATLIFLPVPRTDSRGADILPTRTPKRIEPDAVVYVPPNTLNISQANRRGWPAELNPPNYAPPIYSPPAQPPVPMINARGLPVYTAQAMDTADDGRRQAMALVQSVFSVKSQ